jgi:hypothetical protein
MDSKILESTATRKKFLMGVGGAGAGLAAATALGPFSALASGAKSRPLSNGDTDILVAASVAEALAVTTYTHIVKDAAFFHHLPEDDRKYLTAAREEEMSHYALEVSLTGKPSPYTTFYYPKGMFEHAHVTLNTLVTLEDAFIAAYLVGVSDFSSGPLRVAAARIMGIESDHRTLVRVLAGDVAHRDGGPLSHLTGAEGHSERVSPPNNNGYERTLGWTSISQAVDALLPFISKPAASKAGFNVSRAFHFKPFKAVLPSRYGAY